MEEGQPHGGGDERNHGRFHHGGKGAQQIAGLSNIDALNFSPRDHLDFLGGAAQVSLDHRVEAVLLLPTHLMRYVVDGNKAFGQASLRRTDKMVEGFRAVAQEVKTFHAQTTRVALSETFRRKFV